MSWEVFAYSLGSLNVFLFPVSFN